MAEKLLGSLADAVVIANATGNPDLYRNAVAALIAGVREFEKKGPAGYLIDWPDEPELGFYFSEEPNEMARSRALVVADHQ